MQEKQISMEIERKYLVAAFPDGIPDSLEKREIEQGYISTEPVIRIRRADDAYYLTVKDRADTKHEGILVNNEFEINITKEAYERLRKKTEGIIISKTRYLYPLDSDHTAEIDVFHGDYDGLKLVEVEYRDMKDADAFRLPEWFGENVSDDKRYTNAYMSANKLS